MTKVKVLLKVKMKDAQGIESTRCEVKMSAETGLVNIVGEIGWWDGNTSLRFAQALQALKDAGIKQLKGYINTPGGSVYDAEEIYNQIISFCPEENRFLDIGALCASAGTTIASAFPAKNTRAFNNTFWMMHNPTNMVAGEEKDLLAAADFLSKYKDNYAKRMAKRMNISETTLKNKMDGTWWMTTDDMLKYNIISSVIDKEDVVPADAQQVMNKLAITKFPKALNLTKVGDPANVSDPIIEEPNPILNQSKMKDFLVLLMASMSAFKNSLNENATNAEVVAAISRAFTEKEQAITTLNTSLKEEQEKVKNLQAAVKKNTDDTIKQMLDTAQNVEKKITAETRKVFEEQAPTMGIEGLGKVLAAIPARQSVKNQLENNLGNPPAKTDEDVKFEPIITETGARIYDNPSDQMQVLLRVQQNNKKLAKANA